MTLNTASLPNLIVEYRFSAEPYISASSSNVSVLSMLCLRAKKTL
ncbi:DUF2627 domain-containing protein [Salmonella enterica subsp. enterica serovar Thompson]|nr:DUF2627 domain-containing protein [Salmonella enterica subsp. enterica serovar Ohio]EBZ3944779.1 DUF2627 domain-containing protein [Salmonella enterica subsp. enterica serovar Thompson]